MKATKSIMIRQKFPAKLTLVLIIALLGIRCEDKVIEWEPSSSQMVITEYVFNHPESFSHFGELLRITEIENLLRVRGPFTLLLPNDEAMEAYLDKMNVSSFNDIPVEDLEKLVYNHILQGKVTEGNIGRGTLPYKNGLGDFIASDFQESDIILNKTAIIIKRDIPAANGVVQHIDHVLEPLTASVYDVLQAYSGYSIFVAGLDRAGIADTLKLISFPFGNTSARTDYTILAVPDTLYNRMGIHSVEDLIDLYSNTDDLTSINNGFFQYMDYHCLSGTYYFSDFASDGNYYLISNENYLNIKVELDFKINKTGTEYTGFYYDLSNIPAKNGTIHTVNSLLPNEETAPTTITFQTTDYFDLHQGPYYGKYYQRFSDGQNTFEYIKWEAEFLQYYIKTGHYLMDDDCLNLTGHFWIEITTPKIRKGKYDLSTFMFFGGNALTAWYIDGEYLGQCDPADGTWGGDPISVGEVDFKETKRHTIRMESLVPGGMWWDYVRFTPL